MSDKKHESKLVVGYVQSNNSVMRMILEKYSVYHFCVYLMILSHRNTDTGKCFPSKELISTETCISIKKVKSVIKELADDKVILINSGKSGKANEYYFPLEDFYDLEDSSKAKRRKYTY